MPVALRILRLLIFLYLLADITPVHAQGKPQSKRIGIETDAVSGATIYVDHVDRRITVRTATDNKIRLETLLFYEGNNTLSDAAWFNNLNLELRSAGSDIVIQSKRVTGVRGPGKKTADPAITEGYDARNASGTGIARFDSTGQWDNRKSNINRDLILYIPSGMKLNISSRYGDVMIEANLDNLFAEIDHASLMIHDAGNAVVRSNYAHILAMKVGVGSFQVNNGECKILTIVKGSVTSKNSSLNIINSTDMTIESVDDQYDIDEVENLRGTKDFGDLRIVRVKGIVDLTGNTADMKIRNILPSASLIRIDNKYASVELPVNGLSNYTVSLEGKLTKVQAPFPRQNNVPASDSAPDAPPADAGFKAAVGDTKGAHTEFRVNCSTCTVDFR